MRLAVMSGIFNRIAKRISGHRYAKETNHLLGLGIAKYVAPAASEFQAWVYPGVNRTRRRSYGFDLAGRGRRQA